MNDTLKINLSKKQKTRVEKIEEMQKQIEQVKQHLVILYEEYT